MLIKLNNLYIVSEHIVALEEGTGYFVHTTSTKFKVTKAEYDIVVNSFKVYDVSKVVAGLGL